MVDSMARWRRNQYLRASLVVTCITGRVHHCICRNVGGEDTTEGEGGFGEFTSHKVTGDKNNTTQSFPGAHTHTRHLQFLPSTTLSLCQHFFRCLHERNSHCSTLPQRVRQTA
jgi:hypothetical protein